MVSNLARRAIACKRWRWMPGMLATGKGYLGDARVIDTDCALVNERPDLWEYRGYLRGTANADEWPDTLLPDLSDPCTLGGLLALVREAYGCPTLHAWYSRQLGCWVISANGQEIGVQESSEARTLVAALEAAP